MAKNGGGEKSDFESTVLAVAIGGVLAVLGAWYLLGPYISAVLGVLRRVELIPFALFYDGAATIRFKLLQTNGGAIDFHNLLRMMASSGIYVRWLYLPILPILAFVLLTKSNRLNYQKQHTMASLAKQESAIWPEISPIVGKQDILMNGDEHTGDWAVALTEWEFAEKYNLANRLDKKLDKDAARAVFAAQLGPRWSGFSRLPGYKKGIFAALVLRVAGESDKGEAMFRVMAKSYSLGGLSGMDVSFADGVIATYGQHPNVLRAIAQHAYVSTLLATMLQLSRAEGVLASPMFIWLKAVDRGLWYLLNNVGRYAFHVECAGVAAHWLYEKTVGEACSTPMVESAISKVGVRTINDKAQQTLIGGLEMALLEYTEDDALDRLYR